MSCVLRAVGTELDVDALLADGGFPGAIPFRRGEARAANAPEGPKHLSSGFNMTVSGAGFDDLERQVEDVGRYLRRQEEVLRDLASYPGVEAVCLDFGVARQDVAAQSDWFPAELLWQAGALDIDLVITHYSVEDAPKPAARPARTRARPAAAGRTKKAGRRSR